MLTVLGILLFVAGAILTFAVDRQAEGVDIQAVGWILMAGGGLSLMAAMIRAAGYASVPMSQAPERHVERSTEVERSAELDRRAHGSQVHDGGVQDGRLPMEDRRVA